MIVTRRRRKRFPLWKVMLPALLVAVVVAAFVWPASRAAIARSPLAAPFDVGAALREVSARDATIASLKERLDAATAESAAKDRHIAQLQAQLNQRAAPAVSRVRAAAAAPSPLASPAVGDLAAGATPDMRRTAQDWAAMDPENAAKVAQRLPAAYVARIFALMQPEAAGSILDALPPAAAAALTQEDPQLQR